MCCSAVDTHHLSDSHADLSDVVWVFLSYHVANCVTQETGAMSELEQLSPFPSSK